LVQDKAKIVIDDLWIHGDLHVKSVIDELRLEDPSIPEWVIGEQTREQRAFLDDVRELRGLERVFCDAAALQVPGFKEERLRREAEEGKPVYLEVPGLRVADEAQAAVGLEKGHHWWG
jgi:hypothetical protein